MKQRLYLPYITCITIFVAGLISSPEASAQTTAVFHLKDSTVQQAEIVANSKDVVFISGGSIKLKDISRVELSNDKYKDYFTRNNIPVTIKGSAVPVSPVVVPSSITEHDLDQLYDGLERFRFQRNTGKGLQLVGVILMGAGGVVASLEDSNNELAAGLSIGGAIVATTGFIIDLDASKHLRFKRAK